MKSAKILRQRLADGTLTLGAFASFHLWPGLIEISIRAGFDYLLIDLEHFTHGHEMVADMCATGRMLDFPVLVRPPAAEMTALRLADDLGPCGILVPYVESVSDMDTIQNAIYLSPRGKRRPGGPGIRWVSDFSYDGWKRQFEDDFLVLPQIESRAGLANVHSIAAHPVTTAMAVGPFDLSVDLGVCSDTTGPILLEAQETIRAAAKAAGKAMWVIGEPTALVAAGFSFICVGEPVEWLEIWLTQMVATARGQRVTDSPNGSMPGKPEHNGDPVPRTRMRPV